MSAILDKIAKKLGQRSDSDVSAEADVLREQRRAFARAHQSFRDRAHACVDESIAGARREFERLLAESATIQAAINTGPQPNAAGYNDFVPRLAGLWAATEPGFAKVWHAAVDAAKGFSELSALEFEAELAKIDGEIRERELELQRRELDRQRAAADAEMQALEESFAAQAEADLKGGAR